MKKYFGTDGIRGVVGNGIAHETAYMCGKALASLKPNSKILIGGDTRESRDYLTLAFASGAISEGAKVVDIGICPTAGISYLTKTQKFDYGVVVSASHNPPEYNGIKIFDSNGIKLGDEKEENLEKQFFKEAISSKQATGTFVKKYNLKKNYANHLKACSTTLDGIKIVLDCANGASYKIAPKIFRDLGAEVVCINGNADGKRINQNCGSTHPSQMCEAVKKYGADMGFAFDGDADRIIACDENGKILDGDIILFVLAKYLKKVGLLKANAVVGTTNTNMGIRNNLKKQKINFVETDVGDKYVIEKMEKLGLNLGGEKSGHIIIKPHMDTGDGILAGIKIAEILKAEKKPISKLSKVKLCPEANINCTVKNKENTICSPRLKMELERLNEELGKSSRIIVRASGTEPKIRILVEAQKQLEAQKIAKELEKIIYEIDEE